jgi:hypothetical protein
LVPRDKRQGHAAEQKKLVDTTSDKDTMAFLVVRRFLLLRPFTLCMLAVLMFGHACVTSGGTGPLLFPLHLWRMLVRT